MTGKQVDLFLHIIGFAAFCYVIITAKQCVDEWGSPMEKPKIEKINSNIFKYTDMKETFYVATLPEIVALYGDPGKQFFDNKDEMSFDLMKRFPDDLKGRAQLHTAGITDKNKFYRSVEKHLQDGRLDKDQYNLLIEFIEDCHCSPPAIASHLKSFGLTPSNFEFSTPFPEFTRTLEAMKKFINAWEESML